MQDLIKEGKSTAAIIADFMKETNLKLEEFKFEIVEEGSKGVLGIFGTKPTRIKFIFPDLNEKIKEITEGILKRINAQYKEIRVENKDNVYQVEINSDDPGFLIGKDAKMLDSVQHLVNQIINKQEKRQLKLKFDVGGYRRRRQDAFLDKVKDISEKVKQHGRSITMEPLPAANRRIVHQFVEKDKNIRTMTIGDGELKRVVILPADSTEDIPKRRNMMHKRNDRKRTYQSKSAK